MEFDSQSLFNRIVKNSRRLASWRKRLQIEAYRIYDRDIPEHPYSIDCYGPSVVLYYYDRKPREDILAEEDEKRANLEIQGALEVISDCLNVHTREIYVKRRYQRIHGDQYDRLASKGAFREVREQGLLFRVNLSDYLDTGLFLDHRNLRAIVKKESNSRRVLNLFCYTGSISVYAAAGGATQVTSVDLSNTYMNWAEENFRINGIDIGSHSFQVGDASEFLKSSNRPEFDLIVVDPPSFSNSKKMSGIFDVQMHHAELLKLCGNRLRPGGQIFFSTNLRTFKFDEAELTRDFVVQDITQKTLPEDFRNQRIHKSFLLRAKPKLQL